MMTDPISDMLTRIRNASLVRKPTVDVPLSRVKLGIAKLLEREGFLTAVEVVDGPRPLLRMRLKYDESREPAISSITRISKPGRRVYAKADQLTRVRSGFGLSIVSTPSGLMTGLEARKQHLGGEVICEVY